MRNEKEAWIKSPIVFDKSAAYALNSVKINLAIDNKDQVNYQIMRLCLYVGISLNSEERRLLIDIKREIKEENKANKTFNIPISVLVNNQFDLKMMLFSVSINEMRNNIDVKLLQEQWNNPSLKREKEYVCKFYEYIERGALHIYKIYKEDYSSLKANELIFDILCRKPEIIKVENDSDIDIFTYKGNL